MVVLNRDALELIKEQDDPECFMYLDPPYSWETRTSTRYEIDFDDDQQKSLTDLIIKCKSKILISGYDNALYEQVLVKDNGWTKYQFEVKTVKGDEAHTPKTKIETLWYNYTLDTKLKFGLLEE
jgi:DNA adenine methylase